MSLVEFILGALNRLESLVACALRIQDLGSLEVIGFGYAITAIAAKYTGYNFINFIFVDSYTFNP